MGSNEDYSSWRNRKAKQKHQNISQWKKRRLSSGNNSGGNMSSSEGGSMYNNCYRNRHGQNGEGSSGGGGGGGPRHPVHLKGKDIGMFYRNKAMQKKEKQMGPHYFQIDQRLETRLDRFISNTEGASSESGVKVKVEDESSIENRYTHINESQFKRKFLKTVTGDIMSNLKKSVIKQEETGSSELDSAFLEELNRKRESAEYKRMLKFREKLPAYKMRNEILKIVDENQVVVLSGETGCGKTTQVAQFLLDKAIEEGRGSRVKIACTQPRRISAISVAERVANERAESLGQSVGYLIRLERELPRQNGSVVFCTTGILLQMMQSDPALTDFSHVIIDEIHERSTESDFIIALLKKILEVRKDVKVILMSATLNAERFSKYYNDCATIHIPGFTYPVDEFYLEDVLDITGFKFPEAPTDRLQNSYKRFTGKGKKMLSKINNFNDFIGPHVRQLRAEKKYPNGVLNQLSNPNSEDLSLELIERLIRYICDRKDEGAILVFVPGLMDINKLMTLMKETMMYPSNRYVIYPVHSKLPTADQKMIFLSPPKGVRKIVVATSIAETSITIDDVVYVVDCGKMKYNKFDVENNIQTLQAEWVTLANAKQRRGRAGRVRPGICYHMYSRARELTLDQYPLPEMIRTRLDNVILQAKILQLGKIEEFLSSVLDPPDPKAIALSLELLSSLNALDQQENLTPLGYHLAQLPLDPRTGKMILWASMFSCVDPVFAIAASLSFKDAFYCPLEHQDKARRQKLQLSRGQCSDHIALAEAIRGFEDAYRHGNAGHYCRENFLSFNTIKLLVEMKKQFAQYMLEMKFLDSSNPADPQANRNSENYALIKAIICAGLYPNIAMASSVSARGVSTATAEDGKVKLHPGSVNEKAEYLLTPYLVYYLKQHSTAIYLHDTSCVNPIALIFAGSVKCERDTKGYNSIYTINKLLQFSCSAKVSKIIQILKERLNDVLESKINDPSTIDWQSYEGNLLQNIIELQSHIFEFEKLEAPNRHVHSRQRNNYR